MDRSAPTLLIFTLGAAAERARRSLLPRRLQGLEAGLHRSCLAAVLEAGRRSGCRLEVCSPRPVALPADAAHRAQGSGPFGARLSAALEAAFEAAAGPVLLVGTDTPDLAAEHLARARDLLAGRDDRVVLGPSPDGGLYLLAANRPIPGLARQVRWCGRQTLADLLRLLAAAGREAVLLEPLADLDRPADLDAWLRRQGSADPRWQGAVRQLRRALAEMCRPSALAAACPPRSPARPAAAGRAPPRPAL